MRFLNSSYSASVSGLHAVCYTLGWFSWSWVSLSGVVSLPHWEPWKASQNGTSMNDKFIWIENDRIRHSVCWSREQWGKSQLVVGRSRWISWVPGQLCLCSVLSQDYMWDPVSKKSIKLGENNKFYKRISNTMDRVSIFFISILFTY